MNNSHIIYLEIVLDYHILYEMQKLLHESKAKIIKGHSPSKYVP